MPGPHGLRKQIGKNDHLGLNAAYPATCFPTASAAANSWDIELLEQMGVRLGEEARAQRVGVILGPGVNIKRSPLCGRNFEYYSEDPLLAGKCAAALIRGIQSTGVIICGMPRRSTAFVCQKSAPEHREVFSSSVIFDMSSVYFMRSTS